MKRCCNVNIKKVVLILMIILISISIPSYASEEQEVFANEEYSYDYKKWLELSDEEKANTIAPSMYTIPLLREDVYNGSMKEMILKGGSIPSSYTITTDVPISNQGKLNICWTYASNLVLQTSVQKMLRPTETQVNYSEKHLDYSCSAVLSPTGIEDGRSALNQYGFWRNTNTGGDIPYSIGYWIAGRGPVSESLMPYDNTNPMNSIEELDKGQADVQVNGSIEFPNIYKRHNSDNTITYGSGSDFTTTYTEEQVNNNRDNIKLHIINNGAVYAGIKMVQNDSNYLSSVNAYINKDNYNYNTNHAITIIGWDDNYAITNFPDANRPTKPGAWICANSWGTIWGNNGLFYVSYEDALIESDLVGVTNVSEIDYDKIYQYDNIKNGGYLYTGVGYGANVFEKSSNGIEKLNAVTVFLEEKNVTCDIYVNPYNDNKDINSQDVKKVGTITNTKVGYNTLVLDNPIKIYGDKWVVIEKVTSNDNSKVSICAEIPSTGSYQSITANAGESYIGYNSGNGMTDISSRDNANVVIKARTVELISNEYINFNAPSQILKEGQVLTIKIAFTSEVTGTVPSLIISCGNGITKKANYVGINNNKELVYNYTIEKEDNGLIRLERLTGGELVGVNGKEVAYDLLQLKDEQLAIADNLPPVPTITYNVSNIDKKTNQNIIATISFNEENVTILNNSGSNQYTFEKNESFTFEFEDQVGNATTETVTITSIDKDNPVITIETNGSTVVAKQHSTKVTATDKSSQIVSIKYSWQPEGVIPTNAKWTTCINGETITKRDGDGNWRLHIMAEDEAGNTATVSSENFIFDNTPPIPSIEYTEQEATITATIKFDEPNVTILNNDGKDSYVFKRNGSFIFRFQDQVGNIGQKTATVDKLTAFTEEDIQHTYDIITGTERKYMRIDQFREMQYDGKYTLSMQQMVEEIVTQVKNETIDDGNGNTITSSTNIKINSSSSRIYTYTSTNQIAEENDTAKTGMKLKVGDNEYTMVCMGDVNGDGEITATDASKVKLNIIGVEDFSEAAKYAADIDNNNDVGITDLSKIKLRIVGII